MSHVIDRQLWLPWRLGRHWQRLLAPAGAIGLLWAAVAVAFAQDYIAKSEIHAQALRGNLQVLLGHLRTNMHCNQNTTGRKRRGFDGPEHGSAHSQGALARTCKIHPGIHLIAKCQGISLQPYCPMVGW